MARLDVATLLDGIKKNIDSARDNQRPIAPLLRHVAARAYILSP